MPLVPNIVDKVISIFYLSIHLIKTKTPPVAEVMIKVLIPVISIGLKISILYLLYRILLISMFIYITFTFICSLSRLMLVEIFHSIPIGNIK